MTNQVSRKYVEVHGVVPHYTVDRVGGLNRFIIELYFPGRAQNDYLSNKMWANLDELHELLRDFSDAGYIADRIAF